VDTGELLVNSLSDVVVVVVVVVVMVMGST